MDKLIYYKKYLDFVKEKGLMLDSYNDLKEITSKNEFEDQFMKIFPPSVYNIIMNQKSVKNKIPLLITSDNLWIRITATFCISNPFSETLS